MIGRPTARLRGRVRCVSRRVVEKFRVNEFEILETDHGVWSLRPYQMALGARILSLKRHCPRVSEVTHDERLNARRAIVQIERTLKRAVEEDALNYLMIMMVDKHVTNVLPRYQEPVRRLDRIWIDLIWPAFPWLIGEPLETRTLTRMQPETIGELE